MQTINIHIYGIVQGVGFRPFAAVTAARFGVRGTAANKGSYVEIIAQGERALRMIQRANSRIPDPTLSATIDSIETSCRQILDILGQKEEILPQMRTFLRYYLPTTLKLLNARAKLDRSAYTVKAREVRSRINKALGEVDAAFKKQLESLDEYRFVDLESEIDVLTDMLKADGLLDEENDRQTQAGY